ncbi:fused MFS/spermidine synthase [Noviherbaspirillum malthae]|uniref:fused MFS/spermidine synthase n=1 Tax=Noviherbaspirillum malthae TaxID=1260987 RepID=UPI00188E0741|nr:fused MFS/spermidine synthase [Noviherbaspirillum malthae]
MDSNCSPPVSPVARSVGTAAAFQAPLFAVTILLSAYLLFQVQPLISKFLLPWFGGSPAVWTTAMLFFQSALFGGYLYAHLVARLLSSRAQTVMHLALLVSAAAMATMILPDPALKPTGNEPPGAKMLLLLSMTVGLPYFCLATTGPLIQHWFAQAFPGRPAYRLYALSNAGSFIALLSFPYVFEPRFALPDLARFWTYGFWGFALLCTIITLRTNLGRRAAASRAIVSGLATPDALDRPTRFARVLWVLLPALASLTFIATTDHVSHDIAPEPRLWIATLSLYLLTFILCFDHPRWYQRRWIAWACLSAIAGLSGRDHIPAWFGLEWDYGITEIRWIHLTAMFLICFACHGELYQRRPANPTYLTEYYLWMAFGGACGGLFVALLATNVFADYYEWPLCLVAGLLLACSVLTSERRRNTHVTIGITLLSGVGLAGLVLYWQAPLQWRTDSDADYADIRLHQSRNFYGTISVKERRYRDAAADNYRVFYSGGITHGLQYLTPEKRRWAVSYYAPDSGIGETLQYAMTQKTSLRIAIIGLGAGTLATYARQADHYDFFEINPDAVAVAEQWFSNLSDCRAQRRRVIIGDARLKLEQLPDDVQYDVIVLDAFTGGAVPVHLLTREAFQTYQRHLRPDGFIAINITNGYLNLYPVVRRQAEVLAMGFRNKFQNADPDRHIRHNHAFIISNDQHYLRRYPSVNRQFHDAQGRLLREQDPNLPGIPLWTDHFSSLSPIELKE